MSVWPRAFGAFKLFISLYNNIDNKASVLESSLCFSRLYLDLNAVLCFPVNLYDFLSFLLFFDQFRAVFQAKKLLARCL